MPLSRLFKSLVAPKAPPAPSGPAALTELPGAPTAGAASATLARATALGLAGRHADALALFDDALGRAPGDASLHHGRAATLYRWGRALEAKAAGLQAADLGLADEALVRLLAWCHLWTGDLPGAEQWIARAQALAPAHWEVQFGAATVALAAGRVDDAERCFERAVDIEPDNVEALNGLVVCHLDRADPPGAEAAARRVIAVDDRQQMAWANLGVALARLRRYDEARPAFERALALEETAAEDVDSYVNYGNCLREAGDLDAALRLYERCLPERPSVNAHGDYAFALLTVGRLPEGWREYQFRWMTNAFLRRYPGFDRPAWTGQDLAGRTIMLWSEQGLGDNIQFIRYAPLVKALGATVLVVARDELVPLVRECAGIDRIVGRDQPTPEFDFHCPLMSLPRVFGTDLDSIPAAVPYIAPAGDVLRKWQSRLPPVAQPRVGLVWAGSPAHPNDRYRSTTLAQLEPVLRTPGVQFVSLQKGPPADQLQASAASADIVDLGPDLGDFGDTLAAIALLDLVICVDTSVAHLAGALGKPTWVLLPHPADFRWLERREDSPWYPTMRLFRQDDRRDWAPVLAGMAQALADWAGRFAADSDRGARDATVPPAPRHARSFPPNPEAAGHRAGLSACARTRFGLAQYFPDEPVVGGSLEHYGEYLQGQLELLASLVTPGSTVMEVGAGVGAHAVPLSQMLGPSGHLLAAEPRRVHGRVLRQNLASNGRHNVTVLRRGIGDETTTGDVRERELRMATVTGRAPEAEGAVDTVDGLRLARLEWLKIDAGGQVDRILAGAADTLWRLRPRLFIACPDRDALEAVRSQAREFGYRGWCHETPMFNAANFNRRDDDIFRGQTALALLGIPEEIEVDVALPHCTEIG